MAFEASLEGPGEAFLEGAVLTFKDLDPPCDVGSATDDGLFA